MLRGFSQVMEQKPRLPISILLILFLLSPFITVSGQKPLAITQTRMIDMDGNPRTSFSRGSTVIVEVTVHSQLSPYEPSTQYLLIVEIFNPQGYVAFIGFITDVIEPGATKTAGTGYPIPAGASTGQYSVEVYVWNGWPSQMGGNWKPLADPDTASFTVT